MNPLTQNQPKAIVVGGSLGGLFAAKRARTQWVERGDLRAHPRSVGRPRRRHRHARLFEALAAAGVVVDDRIGVQVNTRVTLSRDGAAVSEREMPQTLTAWGRSTTCWAAHSPAPIAPAPR
ncbi:hypothetical protein ACU4GD_32120 [Cupriavidus basilensis]